MRRNSTTFTWLLSIALIWLSLWSISVSPVGAQEAVVHFHFFYTEGCADCQAIRDDFLPTLIAQHDGQIEINYVDVSAPAVLEQRMTLEKRHGKAPQTADTPEVYIGDQLLAGAEEIRAQLSALIDGHLAQGGVDLSALPAIVPDDPDTPVARFLFFYGDTCPACHQAIAAYLPTVYEKYGDQLQSRYLEIWNDTENHHAFLGLLLALDVPQEQQGYVPTLVIGDKVLVGGDIQAHLEENIDQALAQGGVDYPSLEDLPYPVEIAVFLDRNHTHFERLDSLIRSLIDQYGAWLRPYALDLTQPDFGQTLTQYNVALGVPEPPAGTPQVLIDQQMLVGIDEIEGQLPGLIEKYKAQGGIELPTLDELAGPVPSPTSTTLPPSDAAEPTRKPPTKVAESTQEPIYLAYFEQTGCQECARTAYDLRLVQNDYPQLIVESFSIEKDAALNEWLSQKHDVPEEQRLSSPMIFVGNDVLIGEETTLNILITTVAKYASTGAERTWDDFDPEWQTEAEQTLIERYRSLGALTVFGAGLVNGLNPCAFVTIVFFLSYLAFMGRQGREVLLVGATFTLGVFIAYLLAGLGLSRLMEPLSGVQVALKRFMFSFAAVLCLALSGISLYDYLKARQGKIDDMKIKLSLDVRRQVHRVIREGAQMRAFYVVAFGVGAIVSLIQLTCTSPIYIGIVFLVHEVPEMQTNAFLYLLLYNLAYIVPLVVVFLLAYFGTSSEQLGNFITKRTASIKMLTAVVFLMMAGWLIYQLLPLLGAT